ncbi:ATP-binding protein [Lutibacter citreus]|uniref:ATP-binding protein n=1 Tax=Lutibacter citreus TaxID=2138210 RepID=UPI000DBE0569|nr:ATP-binding protein [Lutibacter citreus]
MSQVPSPFKFLDSYQKSDVKIFFGRTKETTELYNALSGVKHLMVYGPSGSGKTSLVECGLRNRFSNADWYALTIRKGNNINTSVYNSINEALKNKIPMNASLGLPSDPSIGFGEAVEKLFKERFQPIYLLFDQFEELLISGDQDEQKTFFESINKLIYDTVPCRIMLIMREEFIGHLSEFESLCPSILQNRYRVEKMGRKNVQEVIFQILEAPTYKQFYRVEDSNKLAEKILSRLPDKKMQIELAHVQVFLSELWDRAQSINKDNELPVLSTELIQKGDNLEKILESFLKKQIDTLEGDYGKGVPLELLATMISEKFTKLQLSETTIRLELEHKKVQSKSPISKLLKELVQRRILRTLKADDESQFEISHDSLALVVGQNLTEEMKMREKAADIYKVYDERKGLFTQDDIDYLRPYEKSLNFPPELQKRIQESNLAIQEQRQKEIEQKISDSNKKKKLRFLGAAIVVLIGFIAAITYLAMDAKKQEKLAKDETVRANIAEGEIKELLHLVMKGRGEQYENIPDSVLTKILFKQRTYPIDSLIIPKGSISPSNKGGENRNYTMWIDVPSFRKNEIEKVQYKFCRGFVDRLRTSIDPTSSFSIGYLGYGYCPQGYDIDIILKTGDTIHLNLSYEDFVKQTP